MSWQDVFRRLFGLGAGQPKSPAPRISPDTAPLVPASGSNAPRSFVFARELSEVHLLLDNLSTDPDTDLAERAARKPPPAGLPADWLEKVCEIGWVPAGTPPEQAKQAALLVKVKDYLNGLSKPASGSTIAFTFLVTQEDDPKREAAANPAGARAPLSPSRSMLARTAYPDLIRKSRSFRLWMWGMSFTLFFWLLFTCASSWYVAYGNAALAELATAKAALEVARKRVEDGEAGAGREKEIAGQAGGAGTLVAAAPPPDPTLQQTAALDVPAAPAFVVGYCDRPKLMAPVKSEAGEALRQYENVGQMQACTAFERSQAHVERVHRSLTSWCSFWCSDAVSEQRASASSAGARRSEQAAADVSFQAASLANIWATAILPVLYGFLGAGAAIIRSLSRKIKQGLLAPRDLVLSLQQLALGAVVGACIGLFVSQPGTASPGQADLIGPVTLSGSAISFIAGFGVDSVFQALEALIKRIFNPPPITSPSRPDGPPAT